MGICSFDADQLEGLAGWYNGEGVKAPGAAIPEDFDTVPYAFLWSKRFLKRFLSGFEEVFVFGGAGNIFDMTDLFDKTYFLRVDDAVLNARNKERKGREGDVVIWGDWFEPEALKRHIPFLDGSGTPARLYFEITGKKPLPPL